MRLTIQRIRGLKQFDNRRRVRQREPVEYCNFDAFDGALLRQND
ncbi:hypothetical protein [Paraburkholderia terricola]|uniref:Uncharacterized protein n=1 Tax=Paraburkholderia terricola TaxID=169427 RepID=A0ABU1LYF1_9BURK|nr:hypothetical protein [Paraburkholderia terricola]MDR6411788.1 hypothetical protein [Paraburkholderia terricola]MDR6484356.1 hypothetical protein [Paraburkholderia terricola]